MSPNYARTKTRLALTVLPVSGSATCRLVASFASTTKYLSVRTIYRQSAHSPLQWHRSSTSNLIGYFVFAYCFNCSF